MIYLYQFEDGTVKQCHLQPTDVDLQAFDDGCLSVFRITHLTMRVQELTEHREGNCTWTDVEVSEVAATHGQEWHE